MAAPPSSGDSAGRGASRRAGAGDRDPCEARSGLAEVLAFPVPARRHRAQAALARVLSHLRARAAGRDAPPSLPPPFGPLGLHGRGSQVRLPDDVA